MEHIKSPINYSGSKYRLIKNCNNCDKRLFPIKEYYKAMYE